MMKLSALAARSCAGTDRLSSSDESRRWWGVWTSGNCPGGCFTGWPCGRCFRSSVYERNKTSLDDGGIRGKRNASDFNRLD